MDFKLIDDNVAILPVGQTNRYQYGDLEIVKFNDDFLTWGVVLGIGPGHRGVRSGEVWPTYVKVGDRVLYPKAAGRLTMENVDLGEYGTHTVAFVQERDLCMTFRKGKPYPLYTKIVGKLIEPPTEEITPAGIVIPLSIIDRKESDIVGVEVLFAGRGGRTDRGKLMKSLVRRGDTVFISRHDAWAYDIEGEEYVIIDEDQVLLINRPDNGD